MTGKTPTRSVRDDRTSSVRDGYVRSVRANRWGHNNPYDLAIRLRILMAMTQQARHYMAQRPQLSRFMVMARITNGLCTMGCARSTSYLYIKRRKAGQT
jgi:hypothetical protein